MCLGCNRLEDELFTGNDNCSFIKDREKKKKNYNNWRIDP